MDFLEVIRNADSAAEVLAALGMYVRSLPAMAVIPEWCLRLPFEGEADIFRRMLALVAVVNLTSLNLRGRECGIAKNALQVFAAAAWKLRRRGA